MSKIVFLFGSILLTIAGVLFASTQTEPQSNTPPSTASAVPPTHVPAAQQEKKLSKKVNPVYPKEAFDAKLTGIVNLETTIDVDGKVTNVRPIGNANALLVKAAEDAVKQWVYKPTTINGMKVEVITIVSINFRVGE
ncbi:MAG TPA: TonB family protein [Terriglobia bacterium]|nr:TonB family protein [Terriglobia bacterium]